MFNSDQNLMEKWAPVLKHEAAPAIGDKYKEAVTARLLENQEIASKESAMSLGGSNFISETNANAGSSLGVENGAIDPVLISLVRRAMPNLIAYDIAGVQPMTGPTGLIFAMKSRYGDGLGGAITTSGAEALGLDEPNTAFSGVGSGDGGTDTDADNNDPFSGDDAAGTDADQDDDTVAEYAPGIGMSTAAGEALSGVSGGTKFGEMGFTIERTAVEAKTRALRADYTMELAQDLKAVHGLDAESELANILSTEILAEINREVVRTVNLNAKVRTVGGSANNTFDLDSADGRWMAEKAKSLLMELEIQANQIAIETRRGKGNFVICSANVASLLAASGSLDYSGAGNISSDVTGNTFAGTLGTGMKVYIDPYAGIDYCTVGYRGSNPYDAGLFYCPYVPLQMVKAVGEEDFQPRIGFKTRYGMVDNPFVTGGANANVYFRKFKVTNINGDVNVGS